MTLGSLSSDGWGCVSVLLTVWHKMFIVDLWAVGLSRVLVSIWIPLGEHILINIHCTQEFSGSPVSWTWCSHPKDPGPTLGQGIKSPEAMQHGQRKKKKKGKENKQNLRQLGETKTNSNNNNNTYTDKVIQTSKQIQDK